ncbi:protein Aster-C isoform X1 [Procambarus clarkii]|uniref:protein Aster-C isoform X1 n=2 Tax=Procambarus clarkii TaxID=6728 RepID=UPI00374252C5
MTVDKSLFSPTRREERTASFVSTRDRPGESPPPPPMPVASLPVYTSRERLDRADNSSESDDAVKTKNGVATERSPCPLEEHHEGKELLNTLIMLPVDKVFNLIFIQEQFMVDVYNTKKTYDVVSSPWQLEESGQRARQVTYAMSLSVSNFVTSKVSYVIEKQVIQTQTQPGQIYIVEVEAVNSGIPYADAFYIFSHYCLAREDDGRTRIIVWATVKYKKTVWGMMRGMIEKNTYSGMEAVLAEVMVQLVTEEDKIASPVAGVRRRRRPCISTSKNSVKHSSKSGVKTSATSSKTCSIAIMVVLTALVALVLGNFVLYNRLSQLENQYSHDKLLASSPAKHLNAPGSWEAVARILQRQELLHQHQLDQWRSSLKEASRTLLQVQESLENVLATLPDYQESLGQTLQRNTQAPTSWLKDLVQGSMQTLMRKHDEDSLQQTSPELVQDSTRQAQRDDSLDSQQ